MIFSIGILSSNLTSDTIAHNASALGIQAMSQFAEFSSVLILVVLASIIISLLRLTRFWKLLRWVERTFKYFFWGTGTSIVLGLLYAFSTIEVSRVQKGSFPILAFLLAGIIGYFAITALGWLTFHYVYKPAVKAYNAGKIARKKQL